MSRQSSITTTNLSPFQGKIQHDYGIYVFNESSMEKRLPPSTFKTIKKLLINGGSLTESEADVVAFGMKEWAEELGAVCFAHWFQPLTSKSAKKFDCFLNIKNRISSHASHLMSEFSGKQLIKGEPDGSSFPNGGLRQTYQARGYTAWDYTSPVFVVKDQLGGCLYIPAVFCSIFGLSLDAKTPLLRSERALSSSVEKSLKYLGGSKGPIKCTIGLEQEMFIIDRDIYQHRPDLITCGRTLIGKRPSRTQQMKDHYWGIMPQRILNCLDDIRDEMWKLGVPVCTIHNEVAPAQYEIAPIFEQAGIACDHNILLMEETQRIAKRHNLEVIFHEKPFLDVNGSGKHVNWSIFSGDEGLLIPGETEDQRRRFCFFLAAVIQGVDNHADVLRASVLTAGNTHRLGGFEAPPGIISIFLGDVIQTLIDSITNNTNETIEKKTLIDFHLEMLPKITRDQSDRNRTSPFAFIGNRFEFRAVGSEQNAAWPITVLNTIVAESIEYMVNQIEKKILDGKIEKNAVDEVIKETIILHKKIVYNEDCYDNKYRKIMENNGIIEIKSMDMALDALSKSKEMFKNTTVLSEEEVNARVSILGEAYVTTSLIDINQLLDMVDREIIPTVMDVLANEKKQAQIIASSFINKRIENMLECFNKMLFFVDLLKEKRDKIINSSCIVEANEAMNTINDVRFYIDKLEGLIPQKQWPYPSYETLWNTHC
ncbi:glutamine synthetase, putative [Entamoeba dispar SAW760]|uniref:Glutamine synthetase, putative n=1 Tax=Entamoeba dispar (strain ATCC PRA-260 / SAW760) TaxID=370354 RepID=B0EG55_ENTDS|nr:glutamine synthetase, putative [Entamoeba dispar SAW760]EDR26482.1 glutamine synthetase, putative [Entamoeba dispar SAW760]|eukprot:EDR26482.1 glutamine synthetase, putative [Entamoeba dispar SAW760]